MKLTQYNTLDEILVDSRIVSTSHNGIAPISWMPDRLKLLVILGTNLTNKIIEISKKLDENSVRTIQMFPSEYVKAAHNLQLSVKQTKYIDENDLVSAYIKLTNCSIFCRRYLLEGIQSSLNKNRIHFYSFHNEMEKKKVLYLSTILRACCETVYYDNHTSAGDVLGPLEFENGKILIKTFNSIVSDYIFPNSTFEPLFKKINIYMFYQKFDAEFDMIGNYTSSYDVNKYLTHYCIEVIPINGTPFFIDAAQADFITKKYIEVLKEYTLKIEHQSYSEMIEHVLRCIIQVYKPILSYYNEPYTLSRGMIQDVIEEYNKDCFFSTERIFNTFSYEDALETIINPKIKII